MKSRSHSLTIALDLYDRHMPLFLGTVPFPDGLQLQVCEVGMVPPRRHGIDRHRRMLVEQEFDIAEVSLASYILAKQRGAPLAAVPVFPRRLFCQNHIFVNVNAGIESARDLVGKRVGIWSFQTTMSVLAKGDLKAEYDVPWEKIKWVGQHPEEIPFTTSGAVIEPVPKGKDLARMLVNGEIDVVIHPHPPALIQTRTDRIRRLFPNAAGECIRYYSKHKYYPIMHVLAVKEELLNTFSSLAQALIDVWEESKRQAFDFYHDPGFATLAFARNELESQFQQLGADPWTSGLAANKANLERFLDYMVDQGLVSARPSVEELFHPSARDIAPSGLSEPEQRARA